MSYRSIGELADALGTPGAVAPALPPVPSGPVPATPIVRWLEDLTTTGVTSGAAARTDAVDRVRGFHQSALLRVPADLDIEALRRALVVLTERHHMLRARLVPDESPWRFEVPETTPRPILDHETDHDIEAVARRARDRLDPVAGRMLSAVWIDFGDEPGRLLLQIHHLVVDGVSWRSLVPELLAAYTQLAENPDAPTDAVSLPQSPTDFAAWARELVEIDRSDEIGLWRDVVADSAPHALFRRPLDPSVDRQGTSRRHRVTIDASTAEHLLGPVPAALRVGVDDLLLAAFGQAAGVATLVDLEGHGRAEHLVPGADLNGTVGWFTAVHPVRVGGAAEAADQARELADRRSGVPDGGIGYGLLRYLHGLDIEGAAIEFNYLGRYRSFGFGDWGMALESAEIGPDPSMPAGYGLIVDITTLDGDDGPTMQAVWTYQPGMIDDAAVAALAARWADAVRDLARSNASGTTDQTGDPR